SPARYLPGRNGGAQVSNPEPNSPKPQAPKKKAIKKRLRRKQAPKKAAAGAAKAEPRFKLELEVSSNGRMGKATIHAVDIETDKVRYADKADIQTAAERGKAVKRIAAALHVTGKARLAELGREFEEKCNSFVDKRREQQAREAADPPEGVAVE